MRMRDNLVMSGPFFLNVDARFAAFYDTPTTPCVIWIHLKA